MSVENPLHTSRYGVFLQPLSISSILLGCYGLSIASMSLQQVNPGKKFIWGYENEGLPVSLFDRIERVITRRSKMPNPAVSRLLSQMPSQSYNQHSLSPSALYLLQLNNPYVRFSMLSADFTLFSINLKWSTGNFVFGIFMSGYSKSCEMEQKPKLILKIVWNRKTQICCPGQNRNVPFLGIIFVKTDWQIGYLWLEF